MPPYTIRFRTDLDLIDIAWRDTFALDAVTGYARALRTGFTAHGYRPGYRLRMDMTRSAVQPQAVAAAIHEQLRDFPKAGRIAIVTPSAVARLQVQRLMKQPYLRIFLGAPAALDWLLESETVIA